jgi:aldose 1-epimerase
MSDFLAPETHPDTVLLRSGAARLVAAPRIGGSILGCWWEGAGGRRDYWLVPSRLPPITAPEGLRLASYPLIPYSNRVRDGRLSWRGRIIQLDSPPGQPNALHGQGWRVQWRVAEQEEDRLRLEFEHAADAWPWRYRAEQELTLTPQSLTLAMTIENHASEAMPAGMGHHPFFPRWADTTLTAEVAAIWLPEAGAFPTGRQPPAPEQDPRRSLRVDAVALDHAFAGWDRRLVVAWPNRSAELGLTAADELTTLVIFSPPGQPFFCAEPVSHCVDAFNLAASGVADTGMRVLQPGESWTTRVVMTPRLL